MPSLPVLFQYLNFLAKSTTAFRTPEGLPRPLHYRHANFTVILAPAAFSQTQTSPNSAVGTVKTTSPHISLVAIAACSALLLLSLFSS